MANETVIQYRGSKGDPLNMRVVNLGDGTYAPASTSMPMDSLVDEASETVTYFCTAPVGSATSAPVWQVMRATVSGSVTTYQYAGEGLFDQVADNRASLTYGGA